MPTIKTNKGQILIRGCTSLPLPWQGRKKEKLSIGYEGVPKQCHHCNKSGHLHMKTASTDGEELQSVKRSIQNLNATRTTTSAEHLIKMPLKAQEKVSQDNGTVQHFRCKFNLQSLEPILPWDS
jgi:hypothetical protein